MDPTELAKARIDDLIARADNLTEQGVVRTLRLLDELRRSVIVAIADATTAYGRFQTHAVLDAVDRAVYEFRQRYAAEITALQARAYDLGELLVDAPLGSAAPLASIPTVLQRPLLEVAQGYVADLIAGLSADVRDAVSQEIRLGILAGRPPFEVMSRIGSRIDKGRFASIAARAEVITRTETNRVMAIATDVRMKDAQTGVPQLRQQWWATLDDRTRESHRAAHEQIRDIGEPFDVGGEALNFPGDPAGSPSETINCRCRVVPYAASWTDVIEPLASVHSAPDWIHERLVAAEGSV